METGGGPLGHGGAVLGSHQRSLPSLSHSGSNPAPGMETGKKVYTAKKINYINLIWEREREKFFIHP